MTATRRKFDADFREGAVRLVRETGWPIAKVARDLEVNEGDPGELGERGRGVAGRTRTARWARMSRRSWSGCGRRTPNWRWSVFSSARSPSRPAEILN
jgi:hypothetical protein